MKRNYILTGILVLFIGLQFFQVDKQNPTTEPQKDFFMAFPSAPVQSKVQDACYDCHSNKTTYPWYTYVQPVGWWINGHIKNGRKKLNYSEWTDYSGEDQRHLIEETIEVLEEKRMPLKSFTWLHPEANLSESDRTELIAWFKKQK